MMKQSPRHISFCGIDLRQRASCFIALLFASLLSAPLFAQTAQPAQPAQPAQQEFVYTSLLERFTSKACAACVRNNDQVEQAGTHQDLLLINWHVDYLNWFSQQDKYGLAYASDRQKQYVSVFSDSLLGTPMYVYNGSGVLPYEAFTPEGLEQFLNTVQGLTPLYPVSAQDQSVRFQLSSLEQLLANVNAKRRDSARINAEDGPWGLIALHLHAKGEQEGDVMGKQVPFVTSNIVSQVEPVQQWDGKALSIVWPQDSFSADKRLLLVQSQTTMKIIAIVLAQKPL